jgi:hypothetical protein
MEITLTYLSPEDWPRPDGWTVIGRVGPRALAYDEARRPHLLGDGEPEALDPAVVNPALATAVDAAASRLWPGGWGHALPLAFGVNRRTVALDRIAKNGLFPDVLRALAFAASDPDAAGMGWLMSGLARYADEHGQGVGAQEDLDDAERASANALSILRSVRRGKVRKPDPDA